VQWEGCIVASAFAQLDGVSQLRFQRQQLLLKSRESLLVTFSMLLWTTHEAGAWIVLAD
jgi:hypothetical protein